VSDSRVYRQITGYEWRPPLSRGILVLVMLVLAAGLSLVITGRAWSWRDVVISTKVTPPALAWLPTRYQTPEQGSRSLGILAEFPHPQRRGGPGEPEPVERCLRGSGGGGARPKDCPGKGEE
jgi:hypothetical protein